MFDFFKSRGKKRKPEIFRVRISSTFMVRTLCKYCQKGPSYHYFMRNPPAHKDVRQALQHKEYLKYMLDVIRKRHDWEEPKHSMISDFSFENSPYRPRGHHTRGVNTLFEVVEVLTCECMRTSWAFTDKAAETRPEINHRMGRHRYVKQFTY